MIMSIPRLCRRNLAWIARDRRRSLQPPTFILLHLYSTTPDSGFKNTAPSSSKPSLPSNVNRRADEGYLSFTKSSLYKLTLPLTPSTDGPTPSDSKISSDSVEKCGDNELDGEKNVSKAWEEQAEKGREPLVRQTSNDSLQSEGPHSVIFLLHSGQPLSYIANLIRAEVPDTEVVSDEIDEHKSEGKHKPNALGVPPVTFHTSLRSNRRWSPSMGIGDFLREAARVGSFTISIGSRDVRVNVPTFEERTRFLRTVLHEKTRRIEALAHVKDECDQIARRATQRYAFAGAGVMSCWWFTVGLLTFRTDLGWDVMEPVTYLTGFGMAIGGYFWFLWHNREVSYRTVLTESTSRRQQKLYVERGFDVDAYHELITEAKGLRRAIKRVAWDYELDWDQGDTEAGRSAQRALEIVRGAEELDRAKKNHEVKEEKEEDDAFAQVDNDGDGRPDRKP